MKFSLRMLNPGAQLGVLTGKADTFRDAIERGITARADYARIWEKYGVVDPTWYGSGHHWMSHPQRFADPWIVMGYVAARWPEAHINSNFIQLPLFSGIDVAEKVSTLAGICRNGLTLVVGLGWRPEEFDAAGTSVKTRVSRMEEVLTICRALWAGEEVDHEGKHFKVKGRLGSPLLPDDDVTIVIGAQSPDGARRAARVAEGVLIPWTMSHDGWRKINGAYAEELAKFSKPAPKYWALSKFMSVDPDPAEAHKRLDRMETMFNWYSGAKTWTSDDIKTQFTREEEPVERTVTGTPEQVVDELALHASDHPYTDVLLTWLAPGSDPAENLEHFEMLCERVVVPLGVKLGLPADKIELRV